MFTGIVEELGTIAAIEQQTDAVRLTVQASTVLEDVTLGASIAVNGCCLTVVTTGSTDGAAGTFTTDVMAETLAKTGIGSLRPGDRVNLERAVTAGTRLGGHLVQGHVDAVGHVVRRDPGDHWDVVTFSMPADLAPYLVDKGSITVDGVSLTVVSTSLDRRGESLDRRGESLDRRGESLDRGLEEAGFTVSLIPETLARTTLGFREPGDPVNLEVDVIGKYVAHQLRLRSLEGTPA